jgi:plastocyanin
MSHAGRYACAGVIALAFTLVACGENTLEASNGAGPSVGVAGVVLGAATEHVATTDQQQFSPASLAAHVGDVIEWTNTGSIQHTVTFDSASQLSDPSLLPGATWEVKFMVPGTYSYHCTIHAGMAGTIVVS